MSKRVPFTHGPVSLLLLCFMVAVPVVYVGGCAKQTPRNLLNGAHAGTMIATLSTSPDANDVPRPVVTVSIPCSALVFKKQDAHIEAGLEVSVSAFSGNELVGGGVATRKIVLSHWHDVVVDSLLTVVVPLKISGVSQADLDIRARSLYSSRFWRHRLPYEMWPWHQIPLSLLDFQWESGKGRLLTLHKETMAVELLVQETPVIELEPVDPLSTASEEQWWVGAVVANSEGTFSQYQREMVRRGDAVNPLSLVFHFEAAVLPFGRLTVTPVLLADPNGLKTSSPWQNTFVFTNLAINFSDNVAWSNQLRWLEGKTTEESLEILSGAPVKERNTRWDVFWVSNEEVISSSGESHSQEEHLLLIIEANKRFTRGKPGAFTARGRALIRYGIPASIETVGDATGMDERWETWTYQPSGLTLIFRDPHGLGDFMLVQED